MYKCVHLHTYKHYDHLSNDLKKKIAFVITNFVVIAGTKKTLKDQKCKNVRMTVSLKINV